MENLDVFEKLLEKRAAESHDSIAYRFLPNDQEEQSLTYGELLTEAQKIASAIKKNIPVGQRVLLVYPPGLEFIKAFYACLLARVVAVPLPVPRPNEINGRLEHAMMDCAPAAIFTNSQLTTFIRTQLTAAYLPAVVATDEPFDEVPMSLSDSIAELDVVLLQYTSGSTSKPKGVVLRSSNVLSNLRQIEIAFEHTRESVGVIWLPHYHDMGLIGGVLQPLFVGFPVTLFAPIAFIQRPLRWLRAIHKFRATTSGGPNFAYDLCVAKAQSIQEELDLSCWQLAFNGAEPVKACTLDNFSNTFARHGFARKAFAPCYGLAEATLLVSSVPKEQEPYYVGSTDERLKSTGLAVPIRDQIVSCGRVAQNVSVDILHPNSTDHCEPGEVGEVVIHGDAVASGYWNKNDKAFLPLVPNGFRTGDLGFQIADELFVTGRLSDLIVIRGRNLFPEDIEATIKIAEPLLALESAAAFSVEGNETEELILLQEISSRSMSALNLQKTRDTVSHLVMQRHGIGVAGFVPVRAGSLARTSSGKISRFTCKQLYLDQKLQQLLF